MSPACLSDTTNAVDAARPGRVLGRHPLPAGCLAPIYLQAQCRSRRRFTWHSEAAWDAARWRRAG